MYDCGFNPSYNPSVNRSIRILKQFLSIKGLRKKDVLLVQYPTVSKQLMPVLLKKLKKIDISIALIHDIPSLQGMKGEIAREIDELNHFNYLIVHNVYMLNQLKNYGCVSKMISLEIFDYLHDEFHDMIEHPFDGTICVAGNLDKSKYLLNIDKLTGCKFNLYGIKKIVDFTHLKNAEYKGLLASDIIPYFLDGDYGLVWDGNSIDTCSDIYGEYLRINNPHKLSLYIAAGKPIITWSHAAIADFVKKNKIGIAVDSLMDLNEIDLANNYEQLKNNSLKIKRKLAKGFFLRTALNKVFEDIDCLEKMEGM